jgi:hypothetical protein
MTPYKIKSFKDDLKIVDYESILDDGWRSDDMVAKLTEQMARKISKEIDDQIMSNLVSSVMPVEDRVAKILNVDFEKEFGISFEKFVEVYNKILETNPEKLI